MMSKYEIVQRPAQRYAAIATTVPMEELSTVVPPLNQEVFDWLAKQGGRREWPAVLGVRRHQHARSAVASGGRHDRRSG